MDAAELRHLQAPLKECYAEDPEAALVRHGAVGRLEEGVACGVETWAGRVEAGLHAAAGGDGSQGCSANMLLEALVACAGVTLKAVATAMDVEIRGGDIIAEGDVDFRGTLAVSKEVPVGFQEIRLKFRIETPADAETAERLFRLTERYCVVYQTLARGCPTHVTWSATP